MDKATLLGDIFKPVLGLQCMLDDKKAKRLLDSVTTLFESKCLPPGFRRLPSTTVVTICDGILESAARSNLVNQFPSLIDGIECVHYIAALIIYTMESPIPFYALVTFPLNVQGVRDPSQLEFHFPFLKLLHVAMRHAAQSPEYLFSGEVFRGVKIEGNELLKKKHANFLEEFKVGSRVCFAAPTSTSTDPSIACQFTGGIQFVIQGVGGPGLPSAIRLHAGDLSAYDENEVLLESPAFFDVVARTKVPDGTVVVVLKAAASRMTYLSNSLPPTGSSSAAAAGAKPVYAAAPALSTWRDVLNAAANVAIAVAAGLVATRGPESLGGSTEASWIWTFLTATVIVAGLLAASGSKIFFAIPREVKAGMQKAEIWAEYDDAIKLEGKDDVGARLLFNKAAKGGHAGAQYFLGLFYQDGRGGLNKDDKEAVKWYRRSAEQGDARGQVKLGTMHRKGLGVKQDDKEALKWFQKSAAQSDAEGQYRLGIMCEFGRGVGKDISLARSWYQKAAAQGHQVAKDRLNSWVLWLKGW